MPIGENIGRDHHNVADDDLDRVQPAVKFGDHLLDDHPAGDHGVHRGVVGRGDRTCRGGLRVRASRRATTAPEVTTSNGTSVVLIFLP